MAVIFMLDSRPNKHGEHPIRVSICIKGVRVQTSFGYSISKDKWVAALEDPIRKAKETKALHYIIPNTVNSNGVKGNELNAKMLAIKTTLDNYENNLTKLPTKEDLMEQLNAALGRTQLLEEIESESPKSVTVFDRLKEFINEQRIASQWAYATLQVWKTFSMHLGKFSRRITFDDFNENGLNKFIHFLRVKQNLEEKTVQKQYNNLKWFLNWAIRKGYCKDDTVNKYRPKFKVLEKPVIFLRKEELIKLYNYQIPESGTMVELCDAEGNKYQKRVNESGALAKTRDLFCFCCFTSLRYSDMANLRRSDIENNTITVVTQKTNDRLTIELNSYAQAILKKYETEIFKGNLALPVISNQKMNYYLKDLCELCGFNELISRTFYRAGQKVEELVPKYTLIGTHAGRRTFICFALSQGIPPQVVMKWTGHSDYKAMKPYIDIAEKVKAEQMAVFEMGLKD